MSGERVKIYSYDVNKYICWHIAAEGLVLTKLEGIVEAC
jgi:hypothetical protein